MGVTWALGIGGIGHKSENSTASQFAEKGLTDRPTDKNGVNERKLLDKEWKDENLISLINDCINIENNIINIKKINDDLKKSGYKKIYSVDNSFQEEQINKFINKIKTLGDIYYNFEFVNNIDEKKQYILSGEIENIITKKENDKKWIRDYPKIY